MSVFYYMDNTLSRYLTEIQYSPLTPQGRTTSRALITPRTNGLAQDHIPCPSTIGGEVEAFKCLRFKRSALPSEHLLEMLGEGCSDQSVFAVDVGALHSSPNALCPTCAMRVCRAKFFTDDTDALFYCVLIDSLRYRLMRSRFVPRLENCFSQTSVKRASTLRLICS